MHKPPYAGHPSYQKMITSLIKQLFWPRLKVYLIDYLSKNLECRHVKVEYRHPTCLLQTLPIPEWKLEIISLAFITGFPLTQKQHNSIMLVVVEYVKRVCSSLHVKSTYGAINIAEILPEGGIPISWSTKEDNFMTRM